ncbi:hypothetical protein ACFLU5_17025 [Bacteroidota bacterium]
MLEYAKTILRKVSFDRHLFEKELKKALKLLIPQEIVELKEWCYVHFGHLYRTILNRNFERIAA